MVKKYLSPLAEIAPEEQDVLMVSLVGSEDGADDNIGSWTDIFGGLEL